jgi:signal recognition particle subunit SRP19
MSNPRVEEVSDSDPEEMDIDDLLPEGSIMAPANLPKPGTRTAPQQSSLPVQEQLQPQIRQGAAAAADQERSKTWACLYPVYFDSNRTRAQGRRVGAEDAVPNPLAREIVDAVQSLGAGLRIVFEPGKVHPKDWANPGRVRVNLKERSAGIVKNSKSG